MIFTNEEIKLCKAIAEKHRKGIGIGDWVDFYEESRFVTEVIRTPEKVDIYVVVGITVSSSISEDDDFTPLWQISDCLEFLDKRRSFRCYFINHTKSLTMTVNMEYWDGQEKFLMKKGKTILEALLKVILAILES